MGECPGNCSGVKRPGEVSKGNARKMSMEILQGVWPGKCLNPHARL